MRYNAKLSDAVLFFSANYRTVTWSAILSIQCTICLSVSQSICLCCIPGDEGEERGAHTVHDPHHQLLGSGVTMLAVSMQARGQSSCVVRGHGE
jgi:hypothetical protein